MPERARWRREWVSRDDGGVSAPHWPIRTAEHDDADDIAALHRASILAAAPSRYRPQQIRAWLERVTPLFHRQAMNERRVRVALDDGAICGFSTVHVSDGMLNALYVAPFAMHRGVGQALLADAEESILTAGGLELQLHATHNSVEFYRWLGYVDAGDTTRRLPGGVAISMRAMRKRLV